MIDQNKNIDIDSIYEKYADTVYRLAYSMTKSGYDAEDVTQTVFLKFIAKQPEFENINHEKAWFLRVTINSSKKLLTSSWRKKTAPLVKEIEFNDRHDKELHDTLKKLPVKYRTVLHLFYYEDMPNKTIAELLNISESNVKMRLTRARRMLKSLLEMERGLYGQ